MYMMSYYKEGDWLVKSGDDFSLFLENYLKGSVISEVMIRHFHNWDELCISSTTNDTVIARATREIHLTIIDDAGKRQPFTPDIIQTFYGLHFLKDFYKSRIKSNRRPIEHLNVVEFL